ncbi:MAG: DUF1501 domain-containing protein [Acidobacteriota bacterium]|nr:DUF1501 domain-containing protein [Blastocatellia bacterium]MDW8411085.1 DUF1501 domain-containing protein [Acidobacteriota bacterium]
MSKDLIKYQRLAEIHLHTVNDGVGFSRREFFKLGALGLTGFFFSKVVNPPAILAQSKPQLLNTAKNCIFIHLAGAPSHVDTFDLKEGSWTPKDFEPTTYGEIRWPRGLMPKLAEQLQHISIVRSMNAWALVHGLGREWVEIGRNPATPFAKIAPNIGAVVAMEYESKRQTNQKLPGFIALTDGSTVTGAGYLPPQFAPFKVVPSATGILNSTHPAGEDRFSTRYRALQGIDAELRSGVLGGNSLAMAAAYNQGKDMMYNPEVLSIFQYTSDEVAPYGNNTFGAACLIARNIIKADLGTRFIEIVNPGWDHHQGIYDRTQGIYPRAAQIDAAVAKLIADLASTPSKTGKSLLDETLIVMMGEFGRSPGSLNNQSGRDHYLQMSAVFAGGGVKGGRVIGKTSNDGAHTVEYGWQRNVLIRPEDVFCTIYSALGIDYTTVLSDDPFKRGFEYVPYAKDGLYAPIDVLF